MEDKSAKLNGFKPRSYGDIVAVATILTLLVSVVAWGLKLEGELNDVRGEVMELKGQVGNGILPRAEERIRSLERRIGRLEQ
jgi:hypothetical protein